MGKEQKKFQKKKARERAVKAKLLNRREKKAEKMKEFREEAQSLEAINKIVKQRVDLEQWAKQVEGKISDDLQTQIQNNIDILKALEEEYAQELQRKVELQDNLHEKGLHTLPEMVNALQNETLEAQRNNESIFEESCAGFAPSVNTQKEERGVFRNADGGFYYANKNNNLTQNTHFGE